MGNIADGTYEVDPISRIEGHLGVKVTAASGKITDAKAHGNLWRGFENFLLGREANDAITFTQRICGVCPVPHGKTSTYAVDSVLGYSEGHITFAWDGNAASYGVPEKAVLIRNLVLGAEFLMSSITHFYHLVAPSYIQGPAMPPWTPYFSNGNYNPLMTNTEDLSGETTPGDEETPKRDLPAMSDGVFSDDLWSAVILSYVKALRARRLTFEAGALFAGRMPMTSCFVGGGVSNDGTEDLTGHCTKFRAVLAEVGKFIISDYVPIALALGALYPNYDNEANAQLAATVTPYDLTGITDNLWEIAGNATAAPVGDGSDTGYGAGCKRMLAWGAFPGVDAAGTLALGGGVKDGNAVPTVTAFLAGNRQAIKDEFLTSTSSNFMGTSLTEDIANSHYQMAAGFDDAAYGGGTSAYPGAVSRTKPLRSNGYTYIKAPRWKGQPCEVGPFARLVVNNLYNDGVAISTTLAAYFAVYLKGAGLEPKAVSADIAVALVRTGLAKLYSGGVTYGLQTGDTPPPSGQALKNAYEAADAEIRGSIVAWITGIEAGFSNMDRLRARALESLYLVIEMLGMPDANFAFPSGGWIGQLATRTGGALDVEGSTWREKTIPTGVKVGYGATEAPRGALAHFATIDAGKITKYQCVVPTTWNGSPAVGPTTAGTVTNRGAIEAACIDAPFQDFGGRFAEQGYTSGAYTTTVGGVEVLRIAQSFDPCIACAIH